MRRYTGWKTITAGVEKKHRSENKTYEWLREWASGQTDGTEISVYVQEQHSGNWLMFETLVVRDGQLNDR